MGWYLKHTMILVSLLYFAFPNTMFGKEYGIVVDGKLTKHGAIVGRSTRAGDGTDVNAFMLKGLYDVTSRSILINFVR